MCGRFTLTATDVARIAQAFSAMPAPGTTWAPRFNIAPAQTCLVVRMDGSSRLLMQAVWGFPMRSPEGTSKLLINARSETAHRLRSFAHAYHHHRCVMVADGFYEWSGPARARIPHWFHRPDRGLFGFAALFRDDPMDADVTHCCLLTQDAAAWMAPIHDRQPVLLAPQACGQWLDMHTRPDALPSMSLTEIAVSPRVSSSRYEANDCIAPAPPQNEAPQLNLFAANAKPS